VRPEARQAVSDQEDDDYGDPGRISASAVTSVSCSAGAAAGHHTTGHHAADPTGEWMSRFDSLLALQGLDTRLDQERHHLTHLGEQVDLDAAVADLAELERGLAALAVQLSGIVTEQERLEVDAGNLQNRIDQINRAMYDGSVVAHKDLEAMQVEISHLKERLSGIEDLELEQMELREPLEATVASSGAPLDAAKERVAHLGSVRDDVAEEVRVAIAALEADRVAASSEVDDALAAMYESLRTQHGGVGAAKLEGARCTGCHLSIPAGDLTAITRAAPDEVLLCPECNRILVR